MIIGIPKEIKNQEFRVGLTPEGVGTLVKSGNRVLVECGAGTGSGIEDTNYAQKGAEIVTKHHVVFSSSDMLIKVKEPEPSEFGLLRPGLITFSFLSLGANPALADALKRNRVTAIAYETMQTNAGSLPILETMSAITGRLAIDIGSHYLKSSQDDSGKLTGAIAGTSTARILILGAGIAGFHAAEAALNIGAHVTVISRGEARLTKLKERLEKYEKLETAISSPETISRAVRTADVIVGVVRDAGGVAPKLVTRPMVQSMQKGSVIIDACIDQGGCVETSRPTTHSNPVYWYEGIIHYCVPNMPGAVPKNATESLCSATLPYIQLIAEKGVKDAIKDSNTLSLGLNTDNGQIINKAVAESLKQYSSHS
ncbi:MAG: alanine dehydrogenase [SAR202 cluster bacterium Io17-Chloro-G3]|nr:MAG: alanine dehydrogenase [SAR202 cluster bacterium Io17-Chloro-G3]